MVACCWFRCETLGPGDYFGEAALYPAAAGASERTRKLGPVASGYFVQCTSARAKVYALAAKDFFDIKARLIGVHSARLPPCITGRKPLRSEHTPPTARRPLTTAHRPPPIRPSAVPPAAQPSQASNPPSLAALTQASKSALRLDGYRWRLCGRLARACSDVLSHITLHAVAQRHATSMCNTPSVVALRVRARAQTSTTTSR
jgi:hypothetical protein